MYIKSINQTFYNKKVRYEAQKDKEMWVSINLNNVLSFSHEQIRDYVTLLAAKDITIIIKYTVMDSDGLKIMLYYVALPT